jgi:hypothetical protein
MQIVDRYLDSVKKCLPSAQADDKVLPRMTASYSTWIRRVSRLFASGQGAN